MLGGEAQSGTTTASREQENVAGRCSGATVSVNVALVLVVVAGAAGTSAVIVLPLAVVWVLTLRRPATVVSGGPGSS